MPLDEIQNISQLAKQNDIPIHLDGARLWNAAIATKLHVRDYCAYFDSVSLCFSKGLGAPIGSILVGTPIYILV
jgi:threonine aldolase